MEKNSKSRKSSKSVLEAIRTDYTELSQDEFIVKCHMTRTTYQRWARDNVLPRLTPEQVIAICRTCRISLHTLFTRLGFDLSGIPTDKPLKPKK